MKTIALFLLSLLIVPVSSADQKFESKYSAAMQKFQGLIAEGPVYQNKVVVSVRASGEKEPIYNLNYDGTITGPISREEFSKLATALDLLGSPYLMKQYDSLSEASRKQ